jgi:hypothetical protein
MSRGKQVGGVLRQIRGLANAEMRDHRLRAEKLLMPCFQEKPLSFRQFVTVP